MYVCCPREIASRPKPEHRSCSIIGSWQTKLRFTSTEVTPTATKTTTDRSMKREMELNHKRTITSNRKLMMLENSSPAPHCSAHMEYLWWRGSKTTGTPFKPHCWTAQAIVMQSKELGGSHCCPKDSAMACQPAKGRSIERLMKEWKVPQTARSILSSWKFH